MYNFIEFSQTEVELIPNIEANKHKGFIYIIIGTFEVPFRGFSTHINGRWYKQFVLKAIYGTDNVCIVLGYHNENISTELSYADYCNL